MLKTTLLSLCLALTTATLHAQRVCSVSTYGTGCGPQMTAAVQSTGNTVRVTLALSKAEPRSVVIMAIGDDAIDLPALGAGVGCRWLVDPVFVQFHRTNRAGEYSHTRAVSASYLGIYYAQFVVFGKEILTTNGIKFECRESRS